MSALFVDTKYSWRMAEEHIDISVGAECGGTAPPVCTGTTEHRCTPGDLNWRTHAGCSRAPGPLMHSPTRAFIINVFFQHFMTIT